MAVTPNHEFNSPPQKRIEPPKEKRATIGIRTQDLSLTKRVLYQLSYSGYTPSVGIEPTAIGLKGQRSTIWAKKANL